MKTHDLIQGSADWHAYRATHFNASDAPAMLGCSPYKTRNQLLHELHTGISPEVDAATQRRFNDGHRFEALARPLAEEIIGEDLYPVVGSKGELSASFDGLTMDESTGLEHKTLNDQLRAALISDAGADALPKAYRVQMEQQCMVSGATQILFMASKWSGDDLVEEMHAWYEPDAELRAEIIAGWQQFAVDLAAYKPAPVVEKVQAEAIMMLPALSIQIKGEVIASNLKAYRDAADAFIAKIKTDLVTDEDFANADATVKFCDKAEKDLEQAKAAAIAQTASIDELMRTVDHIQAQLKAKRLALDKLVTKRKDEIKAEIIGKAREAFRAHVESMEAEIAPARLFGAQPDFIGAAKNKRTLASLQDAVDTELAAGKIAADANAKDVRNKLAFYRAEASGLEFLFADLPALIQKPAEDFQLAVHTRIQAHKAAEADREAAEAVKRAQAPVAAPTPAPSVTPISPAVARQVIVEQQDVISAFLASRTWGRGEEAKARAVIVEFEKFRAGYQLKKAA